MQPVPKPVAVARAQARCQFQCQRPVTGANEIFAQLNFIRRENANAAPPARNGDIYLCVAAGQTARLRPRLL